MILKLGSQGVEVEKLQNFLGLPINGNFDAQVDNSLKAWQKTNGLKDDGIAQISTFSCSMWTRVWGI